MAYERALALNAWLTQEQEEEEEVVDYQQQQPQSAAGAGNYLVFNEAVLERMKRYGWKREQGGVCRLMPIGVGLFERWQEEIASNPVFNPGLSTTQQHAILLLQQQENGQQQQQQQ